MRISLLTGFLISIFLIAHGQTCNIALIISSSNSAVCSGGTVILTANPSAGTPPYKYSWNTGESTQTININKAGKYTVTVSDNANCVTSQSITIANSTTPATPTAAGTAVCTNNSVTLTATAPGGFYQWYDAPSGGNLVGSGSSYTTPVLTSGRTYYVETTIDQCTSLRRAVRVDIINPINASDVGICQGTTATLTAGGATTYQWFDSATGGLLLSSASTYTTPILNTTTTYYVAGTANGCTSNRIPVTAIVNPAPQSPTAAPVSICSGSSVTLSATAPANVIFNWYDVPAGGSSLITSPDFTTPPLTSSKTYYVQASANGCSSPRTAVTVTVNAIPSAPVANGVTICPNSSTTLTVPADGTSHQWFTTQNSATALFIGDVFQTPVLSKTTTYYVSSANGACLSSRTTVTVTVNPVLPPPSVSGQIICSGSVANLTAKAQQGTIEWYDTPTGGTLLSGTQNYTTPALAADAIYYVQAVQGNCTSARAAVQVTVQSLPQSPAAGGQTICAGNSATLTASGGSSYQWYDAATGGNFLSNNQAFITPALTSTTTYYVQTTNTSGCISPRTAVTVVVTPYPTAPTASDVTICNNTAATLTASAPGGTIGWFDAVTGGNQLATGNNFTTPVLTTTTTYYVQSLVGQCSSTRTAVTVTVTQIPDPQYRYSSSTYCQAASNPVPTIYTPGGGTFSASPAGLVFVSTTTGEINLVASAIGEYSISFTGNGTCAVTSSGRFTVITAANAHFNYTGPYCQKGPNPSPSFPPGASAGVFTATPSGLTFNGGGQINLSQSQPGTYTVTNTIPAFAGCTGDVFTNTVTIDAAPTVNAGANQTVASGTIVQLAGSSSGALTVAWSGGTGTFSNPSSSSSTYTPGAGETSAILSLTTNDPPGACGPQSASVTITFTSPPGAPAAAGASVCPGSSATLTATAPGGNYEWYDAAIEGNLLASGPVFNTPALMATTNYYVQTTINSVASQRTQVTVTVNNIAMPSANSGSGCRGSSVTITASGSAGTYQWYDAVTAGNLLSTTASYSTPFLITDTAYYVQTTINGCVSARLRVPVTVNPVPAITSAETVNICSGSTLNYTITANVSSSFVWSRAAVPNISNAAVTNQTSSTITETLLNTSTQPVDVTYIITPMATTGCPGPPFTLVVTVYPQVIVTSTNSQTICNGSSPNYSIQFNTSPNSYSWSRAAVSGIANPAVSNQASPSIREVLINTTNKPVKVTYVFTINSASCAANQFNYLVTVNPTANIISASGVTICSGVTQNYTIKSDVDSVTFVWSRGAYAEITNPAVNNQTSNTITETLINTSTNQVDVNYFITPYYKGCAGNSMYYTVRVKGQPAKPDINTNSPVCINSTIKLNTTTVEGVFYLWTGPNGFTSTQQNPVINNVTKANAGTYTLAESSNGCTSVVSTAEVAVDDPPVSNAGANQTVCDNVASVSLNGKISGGTTTGIWTSSGQGTFSPSSDQLNAQYIPFAADRSSGSVTLTLASTSKDDCNIAISSIVITFLPSPIANAGDNRDVCIQDASVQLNGSAQNNSGVLWASSGTGSFSPSATDLSALYIPSRNDKQKGSVVLTLQALGTICNSTTDQITVRFIPPPTVDASLDRYVLKGQTSTLNAKVSDNNVHYLWTPNTNISSDTVRAPVITAVEDITYTLTVTDSRGCVSQDQVVIKVLDPISAPSGFTPNGDGNNDVWNIPAISKYPGATVDIYTRNGQQVFHSDGYGIAWDGRFNGTPLPVGVYYYIINTKFQNIKVSGYVSIIR